MDLPLTLAEEVSDAIASRTPVVALESTLISHGLPRDSSVDTARRIEADVRDAGAVPATVAVLDGRIRVGLDDDALVRVAEGHDVVKASVRDLPVVLAQHRAAATTVASTSLAAHLAGIGVFATGGLGGVHRGAQQSFDESADLTVLSQVPVTVVCAGVKSLLDVPATLERLESLSVTVLGYRTDRFPGFYVRDTGLPVPWRADSAAEVAAVSLAGRALGLPGGIIVAQPVAEQHEMDRRLHDRTLVAGIEAVEGARVSGKDVTPFLLSWFHEHTEGVSLATNVALVRANARLAAEIATEIVGVPDRERLTARGRS